MEWDVAISRKLGKMNDTKRLMSNLEDEAMHSRIWPVLT